MTMPADRKYVVTSPTTLVTFKLEYPNPNRGFLGATKSFASDKEANDFINRLIEEYPRVVDAQHGFRLSKVTTEILRQEPGGFPGFMMSEAPEQQ
jgi:hypothetical protein